MLMKIYIKKKKIFGMRRLTNNDIFIPTEVIVEVSYVLNKVYNVERKVIRKIINQLIIMENINFENVETIKIAFELYSNRTLDIVDCLLYAYNKNEKYEIRVIYNCIKIAQRVIKYYFLCYFLYYFLAIFSILFSSKFSNSIAFLDCFLRFKLSLATVVNSLILFV